jgi:hypothetical protein
MFSLQDDFVTNSIRKLWLQDTKVLLVPVDPSFDIKPLLADLQAIGIFQLAAIRKHRGEAVIEQIDFPIRPGPDLTCPGP